MPWQEHVVDVRQRKAITLRHVGWNGGWVLETVPIAAAEDIQGDRKLVPTHWRIRWIQRRIDVDNLYYEIPIASRGDGPNIGDRNALHANRGGEHRGLVDQYVGATVNETLIRHQPPTPRAVVGRTAIVGSAFGIRISHWTRQEGYRLRRIAAVRGAAALSGGGGVRTQK